MAQFLRLCRAWERLPPSNVSLAMLLRAQTTWKPKERDVPFRESTAQELAAFAAEMGSLAQIIRP